MNQKVQDYLNSLRAQKRAEYDKKKSEFLISQGLWEDVRSPKDSWDEEYPYSGYDESTGKYYYFKRSALDVSDEEYEEMVCAIDLDEDDYAGFISGNTRACPYFRAGDEYTIVRKQN